MDELGSGVRNTFKYSSIYIPGTEPELIEDDIFRTIIPLKSSSDTDTAQITTQIATQIVELLRQDPTMSREKLALVLKDITEDGVFVFILSAIIH